VSPAALGSSRSVREYQDWVVASRAPFGGSPVRLQPWAAQVPHRADLGRDTQTSRGQHFFRVLPAGTHASASRSWLV
jgi:hypothetical protein